MGFSEALPDEYYEYLTTGIYPLPLYDPDSKN